MRALVVLVVCVACGPRPGRAVALPEPPPALDAIAPQLGEEQTVWDVYLHNVPIGRAELAIGPRLARTTFRTSRLARALSSIQLEHASELERGVVRGVRETLAVDGVTERCDARLEGSTYTAHGRLQHVPGGTRLHDVHSALGVLRAWSKQPTTAGYLWLWLHGELYRLDVARPVRDDVLGMTALRIDGTLRAPRHDAASVVVWLARNRDRTPLRFAIRAGAQRLHAEVVESTSSFVTR